MILRQSTTRCIPFLETLEDRIVLNATIYDILGGTYNLAQTFNLHSKSNANHTVYLDFDGYTTGDVTGTTWDNLTSPAWDLSGNGAAFTTVEQQTIQRIWAQVSEDMAPFNIDVTTQEPSNLEDLRRFGVGDTKWGMRVVVTPDDTPAPGAGGVAYLTSFNFGDYTPCYVFNSSENGIVEATSHEVGHTFGLNHDGTAALEYYPGHGAGVTSWGPIMGASYGRNLTQWGRGEYTGANNPEDDLSIITTTNGFTYRADDFGNSAATATSIVTGGTSVVNTTYGIIEQNTDSDWFSFVAGGGAISINIDPLVVGPNLAVQAELYNSAGTLLTTVNPAAAINAQVNFSLPSPGIYYLRITGTGKGDPLVTGFTNYGSLGNYRITGTVQPYVPPSTAHYVSGVLGVTGNSAGNNLAVYADAAGVLRVTENGYTVAITGGIATLANTNTVNVDGGAGSDTLLLYGTTGNDVANLFNLFGAMTAGTLNYNWAQIEGVEIYGNGGADAAYLSDTPGNDSFLVNSVTAVLSGSGTTNRVWNFSIVEAFSNSGSDLAYFYDTAGSDQFGASPTLAKMTGTGFSATGYNFRTVYAYSTNGGIDTAYLYDSVNNETFGASPNYAYMLGVNFTNWAVGFENVYGYGNNGGSDSAFLFDSAGNDSLGISADYGYIIGTGFSEWAVGFKNVYGYANAGGVDTAFLFGTAGNQSLGSNSNYSYLQGNTFVNWAVGFDAVYAYGMGGADLAYLYDSAGNDTFGSRPEYSYLQSSANINWAVNFSGVYAYSVAGGSDSAYIYDSAGADSLLGVSSVVALAGSGFYNWGYGFDVVYAFGIAGGTNTRTVGGVTYAYTQFGVWF